MVYVGVDACKAGWFAVMITEEAYCKVDVFPDISSLWNQCKDARLILIDMPIGLWESNSDERACDREARKLLGPKRGSSVFPVPCRDAVYASAEEASEINKRKTGRRLSQQVLAIIPKIKQVDQLLTSNKTARKRIKEIHPEICFWAFTDGRPMIHSKKRGKGFSERMEVLLSIYPHTREIVDYTLQKYLRREVAKDDILDALVAAVTASKEGQGLSTIPENPGKDSKGLAMEMVYFIKP